MMSSALTVRRRKIRLGSWLVLLILLIWFAAPEAQSYAPNFSLQLNSHDTEQVLIQFEIAKGNLSSEITKNLNLVLEVSYPERGQTKGIKPATRFLQANSFIRNSIYVNITTSAP